MASISESDLKKQIKISQLSKIYFLFGDEKFLVKHYLKCIEDSVLKNGDSTFNFHSFYGENLDADDLFSAVTAVPFLSEKKCVRIIDLDITKTSDSLLKKIKTVIETVPESTVLIISQNNIDVNLKKSSKWSNFIKFINKYGDTCEFNHLTDLQISKVLISWAKKQDVSLSTNMAYLIINYCGRDLLCLKNEMEKLCAFVGKEAEVTAQDIERIVVKDITANIFSIGRHILNKDADSAFKELHILLDKKEEPTAILSILSMTYLDMYRVFTSKFSGESQDNIAKIFDDYKGKSFRISTAQNNCKKSSLDKVKRSLELLMDADLKIKSLKIDKEIVLEKLVTELLIISEK